MVAPLEALQKDLGRIVKKQRAARAARDEGLARLLENLERARTHYAGHDGEAGGEDSAAVADASSGDVTMRPASPGEEERMIPEGGAAPGGDRIAQLEAATGLPALQERVAADGKELNSSITKLIKALDKALPPDLDKAVASEPVDSAVLNAAIVQRLLRSGQVELARAVAGEAGVAIDEGAAQGYAEVAAVVAAVLERRYDEAQAWVAANRPALDAFGSDVPFRLSRQRFIAALQSPAGARAALALARAELAPFAQQPRLRAKVGQLMGALAFARRLRASPYAPLLAPEHVEELAEELRRHACRARGLRDDEPLGVAAV